MERPFGKIALDISGPYPESDLGNKYILVVMGCLTKWVEPYAIPNLEDKTLAKVLIGELISRFGVPLISHLNQSCNFESEVYLNLKDWQNQNDNIASSIRCDGGQIKLDNWKICLQPPDRLGSASSFLPDGV